MSARPLQNSSWRKSSRSTEYTTCVEYAVLADGIGLRDSKRPDEPFLLISIDTFRSFIDAVKRGDFDV